MTPPPRQPAPEPEADWSGVDDDALVELLRDAHAVASAPAASDSTPAPRASAPAQRARATRRTIVASIAAVGALAACMAIISAVWSSAVSSATRPNSLSSAGSPNSAGSPSAASIAEQADAAMVMALAWDDAGDLACVRWSEDLLGQRDLGGVSVEELRQLGRALNCAPSPSASAVDPSLASPSPVRTLLVVGMQGPRSSLPRTQDEAVRLARCMVASPSCAMPQFDAGSCARSGCAPRGVRVRVETLATN